ncbi:hypothetical protein [Adhaeribacter aquaticus]|uniref:hypothetical protein n=1 Tax=Adhaeribacter aquaticus TaxID=299567 RepID=UPI0004043945|nr:hypothetical protein [Adhaeribacter aquaticus]
MLKAVLHFLLLFSLSIPAFSQTTSNLNAEARPQDGLNKLALAYYKIKFTKEQRKALEGLELEFIYNIDAQGTPVLEQVNGINDVAILDSLKNTTQALPKFHPKTVNGKTESTLYFMKLTFPKYNTVGEPAHSFNGFNYQVLKLEDFEYIQKSGSRFDLVFGVVSNGFGGNAGKHLSAGGGMKMDLLVTGEKGYGAGLNMSFYGNQFKMPYNLATDREQNSAPPTLLVGALLNKFISQKKHQNINVQLELNYAIQNVTPRLNDADEDWIQLHGFSPGLVVNYMFKIGKEKPMNYYGNPTLSNNYINVHCAIRPILFNLKQASGVMFELGLAYRLGLHAIKDYKIKSEVIQKVN